MSHGRIPVHPRGHDGPLAHVGPETRRAASVDPGDASERAAVFAVTAPRTAVPVPAPTQVLAVTSAVPPPRRSAPSPGPTPRVDTVGPATAPLPRLARARRSAALLTLSGPTLATGIALVVLRSRSLDRYVGSCAIGLDQPLCTESGILDHARHTAAGAGLIGAGLGLVATGITAAVPVRRRVWWIELITGGAALVVGVAWLGGENLAYSRAVADDYVARVGPWADRRAIAASLLGAGVGLALGAGVGLLPPSRRARQTAWAPIVTPTGIGVRARF